MHRFFVILFILLLKNYGFAQTNWNDPNAYYHFQDQTTIKIAFALNWQLPSATLNDIGGISGELHYDADVFYNPRIEARPGHPSRKATGFMVEPGVYRFSIYTSPVAKLLKTDIDIAYFAFSFDDMADLSGSPLTFSFHNCSAGKVTSPSGSLQQKHDDLLPSDANNNDFPMADLQIRNNADMWLLYE